MSSTDHDVRTRVHVFRDDALGHDDATALADRLQRGEVSPTELVEAAIARCEEVDPVLGALAHTDYDRARDRAARAALTDPLAGVPTAFKDNVLVEGTPMTQGSRAVAATPAPRDGAIARLFRSTGLIPVGTTAMPPFGWTAATERQGGLYTRNPWRTDRTSGGSSGGAAALVASGALPLAHANDGGGSTRIPATACGLVGLKITRGLLPPDDWTGGMPIDLASQSILSRSVRDVVTTFAALERDLAPSASIGTAKAAPSRRLRIGLIDASPIGPAIDADTRATLEATARMLEDLGHHVEPADPPVEARFREAFVAYWALLSLGVSATGRTRFGKGFSLRDLDAFTLGLNKLALREMWRMASHLRYLKQVGAGYDAAFGDLDVILSPVVSHVTPEAGYLDTDQRFEQHLQRVSDWVTFTPLQNISGGPAISLPTGATADGLPVGVQLSARCGADRLLVELAAEIEAAHPWRRIDAD